MDGTNGRIADLLTGKIQIDVCFVVLEYVNGGTLN